MLVVPLLAHSLLSRIPTAALGGIVIFAAIQLIDVPAFRRLLAFRRAELLIAVATFLGVLAFDILYGVLIAIGLSVADLLVRVARPHDAVQGFVPGLAGMHDVDDYPDARTMPGLVVYRYDAPPFFANAQDFRRRALAAADRPPGPLRWFVLNVEANIEVDFTALEATDAVRVEITGPGAVFALARVKQDLLARLQAFGLADKIGTELLFPTLPTAVQAFRDRGRAGGRDEGPGKRQPTPMTQGADAGRRWRERPRDRSRTDVGHGYRDRDSHPSADKRRRARRPLRGTCGRWLPRDRPVRHARPGAERAHSRRRRAAGAVRVGGDRARMDRQMDTGDLGRR